MNNMGRAGLPLARNKHTHTGQPLNATESRGSYISQTMVIKATQACPGYLSSMWNSSC